MFVDIANERPYLWALYAIIVVLPFVLCAACCVRSSVRGAISSGDLSVVQECM